MAVGFQAFMFSQSRRKLQINALAQRERAYKCLTSPCLSFSPCQRNGEEAVFTRGFLIILLIKSIAGIEEETTEDESYSEDALQDILEEENITEQAENLATTEEEQSSDFEGQAEVDVTFWSKDGNLSWSSSPTEKKGRLSTENVIKMTPGLTKYATSRIEDIKSCFNLFLAEPIENIVISMTNLEGRLCSCGSVVRALR